MQRSVNYASLSWISMWMAEPHHALHFSGTGVVCMCMWLPWMHVWYLIADLSCSFSNSMGPGGGYPEEFKGTFQTRASTGLRWSQSAFCTKETAHYKPFHTKLQDHQKGIRTNCLLLYPLHMKHKQVSRQNHRSLSLQKLFSHFQTQTCDVSITIKCLYSSEYVMVLRVAPHIWPAVFLFVLHFKALQKISHLCKTHYSYRSCATWK